MIHILDEAAAELQSAADWYEAERPGLGQDLMVEANRALVSIEETPTAWPLAPGSKAARRFVFKRFPYIAYYIIRDNCIWVVAFAHTSRQPGYWHHRLRH